jgi:hypothetical protein
VFAAVEVKAPGGRVELEQANFIGQVVGAGGLAGVAWSPQDAKDILDGF